VHALAAAEGVLPAESHLLNWRSFRFAADQCRIAGAVGLAEGMSAGDEGDRFLVVHGHACEGLAHVAARRDRVGVAVRSFGIHIDQTHLHGGEGVFQLAIAGITAVRLVAGGEPFGFAAPVDILFGFPDVFAAAGEAEGPEAHRFERAVAG